MYDDVVEYSLVNVERIYNKYEVLVIMLALPSNRPGTRDCKRGHSLDGW